MPPLISASSTKNSRLSRIGADSSSCQPAASFSLSLRGAAGFAVAVSWSRTPSMIAAAMTPSTPAPMKAPRQPHTLCMHQQARRRNRRAEHAGEGVHREGLADALARHVLRQHRIVGRVIDGVADAGEREHRHQQPERMGQAGDREGGGAEQQAGDQQMRAPTRSTRKPAGVCSAAETTLNTASARPISV